MKSIDKYVTLKREAVALDALDASERALVNELINRHAQATDWQSFRNESITKVHNFYTQRQMDRQQILRLPIWRIAEDLRGRLMIRFGLARSVDYRDRLDEIIRSQFPNRRAFSEATGISEDMLSHVIAHRKHLAVETLSDALERIGYELRIVPMAETSR